MSIFANLSRKPSDLPSAETATPGRNTPLAFNPEHFVSGHKIVEPLPEHLQKAVFGLGCFWGAERLFWELDGVYSTAAGYSGGITTHPSYQEVCNGMTGHTEAVLVFFDPSIVSYEQLLKAFWEAHNPTQGMRQGNDTGTQYRSAVYSCSEQQAESANASKAAFQKELDAKGFGEITTDIEPLGEFYYAEDYHQQYLAKNPGGYCALAGTGACYQPSLSEA